MNRLWQRFEKGLLIIAVALALVAVPTGCAQRVSTPSPAAQKSSSMMASLPIAKSGMADVDPNAKLLLVQTAQPVTTTSTPAWSFLFGSPEKDTTYAVFVAKGMAMPATKEGVTGLTPAEWAKVPQTFSLGVDSDAAYSKALAASGAHGTPPSYQMGLETYKAASDTSTVVPFVWSVVFEPGNSGATTHVIYVDAQTGAVSVSK